MFLQAIHSENAPKAVGPYSPAVKLGDFVYLSGQIPLDPKTGEVVSQDVVEQSHQVLKNIKGLLGEIGLNTSHIVKTTVFLANMADFKAMNEVYAQYFIEPYPARSTVQVSALPLNVKVEIECIVLDTLAYEQSNCGGCEGDCESGCC